MVLETKIGLFDCGEDGEHICVGFVEIAGIFVMQDTFLFGTDLTDSVEQTCMISKTKIVPILNSSSSLYHGLTVRDNNLGKLG